GLGSVTNLSDRYPWGLWVGFDLLCGVGLAAGGFVITAVVYIFNIEKFRPIVRPTLLTAFLGYMLVCVALLLDVGRPWNMWHPIIHWNPSSVMFEVAWCVMLYSTVLALEVSGMVFEKLEWKRAAKAQKMITVPLVVAGVVLSTLHQSSLGTVYLIVPGKLHPLWYTPMLPVMFWVSSVCAGFAMVIVESRLSSRAFGRQLELPLLRQVGRVLVALLAVYGVMRLYDAGSRGVIGLAFSNTYEAYMFQLETFLGLVFPIILLAIPRVRFSGRGLYLASLLVVMGFILHRLNVAITGFESAQGGHYMPAVAEVLITLMLVAVGFGLFGLAVKYLNVYPEKEDALEHAPGTPLPTKRVLLQQDG
ncbi:MAG: NrfD/PsrC family molybdoenzyme membrane anchor subunit, partial [Planctomycetota bacterium]